MVDNTSDTDAQAFGSVSTSCWISTVLGTWVTSTAHRRITDTAALWSSESLAALWLPGLGFKRWYY